jgi:hypothetical protein
MHLVNIEDWEEIQFEDIRLGDTVAVVKITDKGTVTVASKATDRSYNDEWILENGWRVTQRESLGVVTIYRQKVKFVAPTGLGAVVRMTNKHTKDISILVHCGTTTTVSDSNWRLQRYGTWWSDEELINHFENHEILSEGVAL